jgi:hypothetical protein
MFGIAVVPSILLAVGMAFSPESPRWLFQVSVCKFFEHTVYFGLQAVAQYSGFTFLTLTAARKGYTSRISCQKTVWKRNGYRNYV